MTSPHTLWQPLAARQWLRGRLPTPAPAPDWRGWLGAPQRPEGHRTLHIDLLSTPPRREWIA